MSRLAILISGFGSNQQAILNAIQAGRLPGVEVCVVVSNRKEAFGIARAIRHGVPVVYFPLAPYTQSGRPRADYDAQLARLLQAFSADWVVMAGWMHVLGTAFLDRFASRVLNLHPALPGTFPGIHAIQRAYEAYRRGEIEHTGVMVHLVSDPGVDVGPVVRQQVVAIQASDSLDDLEARVHAAEHELLVAALRDLFCEQPDSR